MAPSITNGAVKPVVRSAAKNVVVFQCPCGTLGRPQELPQLQLHQPPPDATEDAMASLRELRRFGTLGGDQPD